MKYTFISTAVICASLIINTPAFGSIYADLFERTVTGKNNGSPLLEITNGTSIIQATENNAKSPPGMQDLGPNEKITVPMTRAGFAYYMNKYQQLKENEKVRDRSQSSSSMNSSSQSRSQCPPGKRIFQRTALFGLIKGEKLCLSDFEAESLRAQRQRDIQNNIQQSQPKIINCTSNSFGSYMSTTCY